MPRSTIRQKTLYTDRRYHQPSHGLGAIYETQWSTLQNSPIYNVPTYESGVNIGNFQLKFNNGENNDALVHKNGEWLTPNSGEKCVIELKTGDKGKILETTIIRNKGKGYKVGDKFSVIQLGGIDGLIEVTEIGGDGSVTKIKVLNPGMGYNNTPNPDDYIVLNDYFWTNQEVRGKDETELSEKEADRKGIPDPEWRLKLDWSFFNNFALYGSLTELIKASLLGIINEFPASLWMTDGFEPSNPFNINLFTSDDNPYIDDIRVFQQNHNRYEVVDTRLFTYTDECSGNTYEELYLTECRRKITEVISKYRYVYIKKNDYVGYISEGAVPDTKIPTHPNYYPYYTLDNNNIIVTTTEVDILTKQERYERSGGTGYKPTETNPIVIGFTGTGTGAKAEAFVFDGIITHIKVINSGSGYSSNTQVTISGGGGSGAKAVPKVENGQIIHVDVIAKVDIGCVGDAYYQPLKLLDTITINVGIPNKTGTFTYNTCCNCDSDQKYNCNNNLITFDIVFNYDDENAPCTLINYITKITGGDADTVGYHIIPKEEYITSFFKNLDDFQRRILNQNTFPKYTSMFYVPDVDNEGAYTGTYVNETFRIYTLDGWNLDLTGNIYQHMMTRLLDAAEYLDNMKCDNIYRMITHDSIKNLDWSLRRMEDAALAEAHIFGETQLKKILRVYGRLYDEIKKYIHGVEIMNNLTYNQLDNYPDGILRTNVDTFGWKSVSIIDEFNFNVITEPLYYGWRQKYNSTDIESEFFRRLLINSPHIMRWKGTKNGVEMLMNLFGIERDKWSINEFVYVAEESSYGKLDNRTDKTEMLSNEYIIDKAENNIKPYYEYDVYENPITYNTKTFHPGQSFWGVEGHTTFTGSGTVIFNPIKNIETLNYKSLDTENGIKINNEIGHDVAGELIEERTFPPICMSRYYVGGYVKCKKCNGRGVDLKRRRCEECKGLGMVRNYVAIPAFPGNSDRLYYQQYGGWYQDTQPEMIFKQNISQLIDMVNNSIQSEGLIVFVKDDSEWKNPLLYNVQSNYWVLINDNIPSKPEGWYNLSLEDAETEVTVTTRHVGKITINIPAYSTVPATNEGNNPHSGGVGGYDYGNSYLQHFGYDITKYNGDKITSYFNPPRRGINQVDGGVVNAMGIFNNTLEKTPECLWGESQYYNLENVGFKLQGYLDNKGCWAVYRNEGYSRRKASGFLEEPKIDGIKPDYKEDILKVDDSYAIYPKKTAIFEDGKWVIKSDEECVDCDFVWKETDHNTRGVNLPETDFYRIINCKNITFTYNSVDDSDAYFFMNTLLPYLEDILPANTIIHLEFGAPISCGVGVMHIPGGELDGNQCIDEDREAINRVAKLRNVPCGPGTGNPCSP